MWMPTSITRSMMQWYTGAIVQCGIVPTAITSWSRTWLRFCWFRLHNIVWKFTRKKSQKFAIRIRRVLHICITHWTNKKLKKKTLKTVRTCDLIYVRTDTKNFVTSSLIFGRPACVSFRQRCTLHSLAYSVGSLKFQLDTWQNARNRNFSYFSLCRAIAFNCLFICWVNVVARYTHNLLFILHKWVEWIWVLHLHT